MEAQLLESGLSANTVHHIHVALAKSLKVAPWKGLVYRNICLMVDALGPERYEVRVPEIEAIGRILKLAQKTPYGAVFNFMAYTGVRRGEAVALRWANIDLDRSVASITETAQRLHGKGIVYRLLSQPQDTVVSTSTQIPSICYEQPAVS